MGHQHTISEFLPGGDAESPDSRKSPEDTYRSAEWLRKEYHDKNRATTDIADELGVAVSTICNWLNRHNIDLKSNLVAQTSPDAELLRNVEWLRTQYSENMRSCEDIGKSIGVSGVTVGKWLKKHDIDRRSASEARAEGNVKPLHNEEWLREKYVDQHRSTYDIAEELDLSRTAVSRWLDRHNIEKRGSPGAGNQPIEELQNEEWLRDKYVDHEQSTYEIADQLGAARTTVCAWIRRHGIEFRSPSQRVAEGDTSPLANEEWLREQYVSRQRSSYDIADYLGLTPSTIRSYLMEYEIERRTSSEAGTNGNVKPLHNSDWLREQYENKEKSTYDIAQELDIARTTVSSWLHRHDIDTRGNTEAFGSAPVEELQDAEWLYGQYHDREKSCEKIATEVGVDTSTVQNWLHRHDIEVRSGLQHPDHLDHPVRSDWEYIIADLLIQGGIEYEYESLKISYGDGRTYTPDFVTESYIIEVKGIVYDHAKQRRRAMGAMKQLDNREYVVVGTELPADHHIPWENKEDLLLLLN